MFNRPNCANRTFTEIRKARPETLYLIADGPRQHKQGEAKVCAATRRVVEDMIDWPCNVHKIYSDTNMGCGVRIISSLNFVFENEEQCIILEDDILPDPSFFDFCDTLLDRYRHADQVMQISGYCPFKYRPRGSDYLFSRYAGIWGWATWRRAWEPMKKLDEPLWSRIKDEGRMQEFCLSTAEHDIRTAGLDRIFSEKVNNWDSKWTLVRNIQKGFGVVPKCNLTKNIGFSTYSTHTFNPFNSHRFSKIESITPPYVAPEKLQTDETYDFLYNKRNYSRYVKLRTAIWNLVHSHLQRI